MNKQKKKKAEKVVEKKQPKERDWKAMRGESKNEIDLPRRKAETY